MQYSRVPVTQDNDYSRPIGFAEVKVNEEDETTEITMKVGPEFTRFLLQGRLQALGLNGVVFAAIPRPTVEEGVDIQIKLSNA